MHLILGLLFIFGLNSALAQAWKTLPKGVRIVGYKNVTTSRITSNFNQFGSQSSLGTEFQIDAATFNSMMGTGISQDPNNNFNNVVVGAYAVDASAQVNVQGMGFGYGITNDVMFYAEVAHYKAQVRSRIRRTRGNTYEQAAQAFENENGGILDEVMAENLRRMIDADERTIQSVITNVYDYQPIGDWYGEGFGDMETGFMVKVLERDTWGLQLFPGAVLPTGRQDDPDILQDIGFGDGQFDFFTEAATGYVATDALSFGATLRYTYQAPTRKTLRVPTNSDVPLSTEKGEFDVKYGNKLNAMVFTKYNVSDWISLSQSYRYMKQEAATFDSKYGAANRFLEYNSDKNEHQIQSSLTLSSITPFLKKAFPLPASVGFNYVDTLRGKNVPKVSRYEIEFRMLF